MEYSEQTKTLIRKYEEWYAEAEEEKVYDTISVDEVAARVAAFYEKIRGVVDWREEHLLKKTAIARMIKRRVLVSGEREKLGEGLLHELIRGGHFPNERVAVSKVDEVQAVTDKYTYLIDHIPAEAPNTKKYFLGTWLLDAAASEIEETINPPVRERALIEYMLRDIEEHLDTSHVSLSDSERRLHLFIAVQRALFKLDNSSITQHILEKLFADWAHPSRETLDRIAAELPDIAARLEKALKDPVGENFYHLAEQHDTPYLLIGDILSEHPKTFSVEFPSSESLDTGIKQAYDARLHKLKAKIRRAAMYSTLSIFLTKVLIAVAIEVPLDRSFGYGLNALGLGISIFIPPLLMLFLIRTAKTSSDENFQRVVMEILRIVYQNHKRDTYVVHPLSPKRGPVISALVHLMYAVSFAVSFGGLAYILLRIHSSISSIFIFLIFVSLIAFAGTIIRQRARELMVVRERDGFLKGLIGMLSLPILQVGKWLSGQIARYNLLVFILNFLIEIPFQVFIEFIEQWRAFLKEKQKGFH